MRRHDVWISKWNPEDEKFWEAKGKSIARRNLIWSIFAEHLGFSIWLVWSIVATKLPQAGFHYTTDQLFQLVALPGLIGSLIRFPYTFAVTTFGGRNWTIFSAAVLFILTLALAYFVTQPDTPFWLMLLLALTIAVVGAYFFMNNLTEARSSFIDRLVIVRRKHTWVMSYLYIGTFGSFIGYSGAFPLLLKTQFPAVTVGIAFLGPLVGSLSRPLGGLLADKIGGARVTFWNFIAMGAATIGVMYFVDIKGFAGFLTMFLILFVTTGVGNGSTYRMIPSIFREEKLKEARGSGETGRALALKAAGIEAAAALGCIGAIGAGGGYLIPSGFGKSIAIT